MVQEEGHSTRSARAQIAEATRGIHEALHRDAILRRLTEPDISRAEYYAALSVLSSFYDAVEQARARTGAWPAFSLHRECAALRRDLSGLAVSEIPLELPCARSLLGGLYVAHGASFGRSVFCRNVTAALPREPMDFVRQKCDKSLWRALLAAMEDAARHAGGLEAMRAGATAGFDFVMCRSRSYRHRESAAPRDLTPPLPGRAARVL